MNSTRHIPVLLSEVVASLLPRDGALFVDGTFGGGGYTKALLEAAKCSVYAIDRDPDAIARGQSMVTMYSPRLTLIEGAFGDMQDLLAQRGVTAADGVALDIGVSSDQIDRAERGFSFQSDGPLDMRMSASGLSAADVVNTYDVDEIARILFLYGEERRSRAIARLIVETRKTEHFTRTSQLADVCMKVLGRAHDGPHPAMRTFQALRIYVNDELGELVRGLGAAERLLKPKGRLAVVSFHSLEDRIVKQFLSDRSGRVANPSRHMPLVAASAPPPSFRLIDRGGVQAGQAETARNSRSRSARLRSAERTDAPPIPLNDKLMNFVQETSQ